MKNEVRLLVSLVVMIVSLPSLTANKMLCKSPNLSKGLSVTLNTSPIAQLEAARTVDAAILQLSFSPFKAQGRYYLVLRYITILVHYNHQPRPERASFTG